MTIRMPSARAARSPSRRRRLFGCSLLRQRIRDYPLSCNCNCRLSDVVLKYDMPVTHSLVTRGNVSFVSDYVIPFLLTMLKIIITSLLRNTLTFLMMKMHTVDQRSNVFEHLRTTST